MAVKGISDSKCVSIFICLIPYASIHTKEFAELLFREAGKKRNITNSLIASFLFS